MRHANKSCHVVIVLVVVVATAAAAIVAALAAEMKADAIRPEIIKEKKKKSCLNADFYFAVVAEN